MTITQGHRYKHGLNTVLAMQSGEGEVEVRRINPEPWSLGPPYLAHAMELHAEPMKYFHGQTAEGVKE